MFKDYMKNAFLLLVWSTYVFSCSFLQADSDSSNHVQQVISPLKEEKKLCLTMIVKNESRIIERCLTSVKDIIDCISICDTGSTDNTIEIIEKFMQENKIPGKVHRHIWQNFGHNRTLSVQAAQKTLQEIDCPLQNTYLLLLDADMILKVDPYFDKSQLKDDAYMIVQKYFDLSSYFNTRLVRASMPWESLGVTHEYWSCKNAHQTGKLATLWIDDREDGGCKADKFERDIKLLTQGLKDEPDNMRYMFYLAQSYKCLQRYNEAIRWYKERIERGGWQEEVWYSKLMIAECYQDLGFWDQALHWYLDAYQHNSDRAEPLQKIATYYRLQGQNHLAYLFAKEGARICYPKDQILFISDPVYNYQFDEEISIAAFYTPFKAEGFAAANRLVLNKKAPQQTKEQAYKNMLFYVQNLDKVQFQPIIIDLPFIRKGLNQRYRPMNPSIQKTDDGYRLICRTVNFNQKNGKDYHSLDPLDQTIRTRNFLIYYDREFKLISQKEIIEDLPREKFESSVVGLEDCRLIESPKNVWFLATTYDTHPGKIQQSLCKLASESVHNAIYVEKLQPLKSPDGHRCEKNWLPFTQNKELYAIYSYDPFILYKVNPENGTCEKVIEYEPAYDFSHFRGSAAPIEFNDGYLVLVHEVVFSNNDKRHYLHRFLYFDRDFNVTKLSKPFTFFHKGIEYCCGMAIDHAGQKCILSISHEDQKAYFAFIKLDDVRNLLELLPKKN